MLSLLGDNAGLIDALSGWAERELEYHTAGKFDRELNLLVWQ